MATISIASAKGGCGKTTLGILLGTELALEGYKVALLDCDVNQHATAFGKKARIDGFAVVPSIDEGTVKTLGVAYRSGYDWSGVSPAGDQEWGGCCAWWRVGSRVRRAASMCWRSSVPGISAIWRIWV